MAREKDFREYIEQQQWNEVISSWHIPAREVQTQFTNYKILHRFYWTPSRMATLKLRNDALCWRCHKETGTLVHMFYGCDMVRNFWDEIISFINKLYCISLTKSPALCMLGIIPSTFKMCELKKLWCRLAMLTGCRIIARQWKTTSPSSFKNWIELMTNIANYERVISRLSGHQDSFLRTWSPFLDNIKSGQWPRTDLTHPVQ